MCSSHALASQYKASSCSNLPPPPPQKKSPKPTLSKKNNQQKKKKIQTPNSSSFLLYWLDSYRLLRMSTENQNHDKWYMLTCMVIIDQKHASSKQKAVQT